MIQIYSVDTLMRADAHQLQWNVLIGLESGKQYGMHDQLLAIH